MSVLSLKQQYNQLLERQKRAENYLDNNKVPIEERLAWLEEYKKITQGLSTLLRNINDYSINDGLNGFREKEGERSDLV